MEPRNPSFKMYLRISHCNKIIREQFKLLLSLLLIVRVQLLLLLFNQFFPFLFI